MNLKEAKLLKARMSRFIRDLEIKRSVSSVVDIAPGEDPLDYISDTPDFFTKKIEQVSIERCKLNEAFRQANAKKMYVDKLGGDFSTNELLDKVSWLRQELGYFKSYSGKLPKTRNIRSNLELISTVTYDIKKYRERANLLENEAETLSNVIDALDNIIEVDYVLPNGLLEI